MLTWAGLLLRSFPQDLRLLGAERLQTSQLLRQLCVGQSQIHPFGGEEESVRDAVNVCKMFVRFNDQFFCSECDEDHRRAVLIFISAT